MQTADGVALAFPVGFSKIRKTAGLRVVIRRCNSLRSGVGAVNGAVWSGRDLRGSHPLK